MSAKKKKSSHMLAPSSPSGRSLKRSQLKDFIEMGAQGHFPLFGPSWSREIPGSLKKPTDQDRHIFNVVTEKLKKHHRLDRQQLVLMRLSKKERDSFVRTFLSMVENRILDNGSDFH